MNEVVQLDIHEPDVCLLSEPRRLLIDQMELDFSPKLANFITAEVKIMATHTVA